MRKKTIRNVADTVFWYSLYMLPLIIVFVSMFQILGNEVYLTEYFAISGNETDLIFNVFAYSCEPLREWFSSIGMFDRIMDFYIDIGLASGTSLYWFVIWYVFYFVIVYIIHVCIDFLLFIPRLAHKWMNAFTRED